MMDMTIQSKSGEPNQAASTGAIQHLISYFRSLAKSDAAEVDGPANSLDMNQWHTNGEVPSCDTPACVAGHAVFALGGPKAFGAAVLKDLRPDGGFWHDSDIWTSQAQELIGLTHDECDALFFTSMGSRLASKLRAEDAVAALEALLAWRDRDMDGDDADLPVPDLWVRGYDRIVEMERAAATA